MDSLVDNIFVINMDRDVERLGEFDTMMTTANWDYTRKSGINGKRLLSSWNGLPNIEQLKSEALAMNKYVSMNTWLSKSEVGCLLSHVTLWEDLVNDPSKNRILIFEDDARTHLDGQTVVRLLTEFYAHLRENNINEPDMLYLGKALDSCYEYEKVWNNVYRSKHPLCLHAYIMTKNGARRLLEMAPFSSPIDMIPIQGIQRGVINVMSFHPSLYFQDIFSNLSNQRSSKEAINVTAECLFSQQQPLAPDTYYYMAIVIIALLAVVVLFIVYFVL